MRLKRKRLDLCPATCCNAGPHTPLYWEETTLYSTSLTPWARSCTDSGGTSSTPVVLQRAHIHPAGVWPGIRTTGHIAEHCDPQGKGELTGFSTEVMVWERRMKINGQIALEWWRKPLFVHHTFRSNRVTSMLFPFCLVFRSECACDCHDLPWIVCCPLRHALLLSKDLEFANHKKPRKDSAIKASAHSK